MLPHYYSDRSGNSKPRCRFHQQNWCSHVVPQPGRWMVEPHVSINLPRGRPCLTIEKRTCMPKNVKTHWTFEQILNFDKSRYSYDQPSSSGFSVRSGSWTSSSSSPSHGSPSRSSSGKKSGSSSASWNGELSPLSMKLDSSAGSSQGVGCSCSYSSGSAISAGPLALGDVTVGLKGVGGLRGLSDFGVAGAGLLGLPPLPPNLLVVVAGLPPLPAPAGLAGTDAPSRLRCRAKGW